MEKFTKKAAGLFDIKDEELSVIDVTSVEYDSRKVKAGSCFVAVKGFAVDGHDYINQAIDNGASLVVIEEGCQLHPSSVKTLQVQDSRAELGRIASSFYDNPSAKLGVIGITGTNGKTTLSFLIEAILKEVTASVSRFGTIEYSLPDEVISAPNTTPESADLQRMFAKSATYHNPRAVMEVSSHGIALGRLAGTTFKGAVFTNLTQDHLDFHENMNEYAEAKRRLFTTFPLEYSVINIDDQTGAEWVAGGVNGRVVTYGFTHTADVYPTWYESGWNGTSLKVATPVGEMNLHTPLPGKHNTYNVLAAISVAVAEGIDAELIAKALGGMAHVAGRFEVVLSAAEFAVVVDYAHTDDALKNVLTTARELTTGRLICLFGCGGDRDNAKRPLMGRAADSIADVVIVTSDNPRTEDPNRIIEQVLLGITAKKGKNLLVIPDRQAAIEAGVNLAKKGDCLLLAGKGHEDYQIIGTKKNHFDDREVAHAALEGLL